MTWRYPLAAGGAGRARGFGAPVWPSEGLAKRGAGSWLGAVPRAISAARRFGRNELFAPAAPSVLRRGGRTSDRRARRARCGLFPGAGLPGGGVVAVFGGGVFDRVVVRRGALLVVGVGR